MTEQPRTWLRRRRARTAIACGVAAVLAVAGVSAFAASRGGDRAASLGDRAAYEQQGAWLVGRELHVGDHVVRLPGRPSEIGYTSQGVLVFDSGLRLGGEEVDYVDSNVFLVTPAGEIRPIPSRVLAHAESMPATDPDLPYAAVSVFTGKPNTNKIVLVDIRTGKKRVVGDPIKDPRGPATYDLGLGSDLVAYAWGSTTRQLNWHTGKALPARRHGSTMPWSYGQRAYVSTDLERQVWRIRDRRSRDVLLTVPFPAGILVNDNPSLSEDDRWFAVPRGEQIVVHEVSTGATTTLDGVRGPYFGWTPDGHLIGRSTAPGSLVTTCDPATGACVRSDDRWPGQSRPVLVGGAAGETPDRSPHS